MQVNYIQGNTFRSVYTASNFNRTPVQERMVNTIKYKLVNDNTIYKKNKNLLNFLESKGLHYMLSNGENLNEVRIDLGFKNRKDDTKFISQWKCGSYNENCLDDIVERLKKARQEENNTDIQYFVNITLLGSIPLGYILARIFGKI